MAREKYCDSLKMSIMTDYRNGDSQSKIAKKYNINRSIICRLIKKYYLTKSVTTVHLGGRPRKTDPRTDMQMCRVFKKNPFATSNEVVRTLNLNIHASTVRRRAIENNLRSYRPAKKPMLTKKHLQKRLNFANAHCNWSVAKWKTVLFSDESKFNMINSDGMSTVRRHKGKRHSARNCRMSFKHGGGSIMVWTCFSGSGVGPFKKIDGIMDRFLYKSILETNMLPYAEWNMPLSWVFQHDNDPKHTSKLVKDYLRVSGVQVLDWPAQSPDLNPIENLFGILKRAVSGRRFGNREELFDTLKMEWINIPQTTIDNLIASMPRRCAEVIKAKGSYTKY